MPGADEMPVPDGLHCRAAPHAACRQASLECGRLCLSVSVHALSEACWHHCMLLPLLAAYAADCECSLTQLLFSQDDVCEDEEWMAAGGQLAESAPL